MASDTEENTFTESLMIQYASPLPQGSQNKFSELNSSASYLNQTEVHDDLETPWVLPTPTTAEKPWKLPRKSKTLAYSQDFLDSSPPRRQTVNPLNRQSANSSSILPHSLGTMSTLGRQNETSTSRARPSFRQQYGELNTSNSERILGVVNRMVDDINRRTLTEKRIDYSRSFKPQSHVRSESVQVYERLAFDSSRRYETQKKLQNISSDNIMTPKMLRTSSLKDIHELVSRLHKPITPKKVPPPPKESLGPIIPNLTMSKDGESNLISRLTEDAIRRNYAIKQKQVEKESKLAQEFAEKQKLHHTSQHDEITFLRLTSPRLALSASSLPSPKNRLQDKRFSMKQAKQSGQRLYEAKTTTQKIKEESKPAPKPAPKPIEKPKKVPKVAQSPKKKTISSSDLGEPLNLKRFMPFYNQTDKKTRVRNATGVLRSIDDPIMERKQIAPPSLINSNKTTTNANTVKRSKTQYRNADPVMERKQTAPPSLINKTTTNVNTVKRTKVQHQKTLSSGSLPLPCESPTLTDCMPFD